MSDLSDFKRLVHEPVVAALDECRRAKENLVKHADVRMRDIARLNKALDECRRERDDADDEWLSVPVYRYRDSIIQTLVYVSNHIGGGDHDTEIAEMVAGLLKNLGVE